LISKNTPPPPEKKKRVFPVFCDLPSPNRIVFGLWQLVFGLIHINEMKIKLKTKDQQLKTARKSLVFGNWSLV
jgi:hypothetical protein